MIRGPGIPPARSATSSSPTSTSPRRSWRSRRARPTPALDGRSLLPYAQNTALRSTRPLLLEADTGPGQGSRGVDPQVGERIGAVKAQEARVAGRGASRTSTRTDGVKSAANGNFAPAYRAIRTDRYLYVLYGNGQSELYDMKRDPAQQNSLHKDRRYRPVRKCSSPTCRVRHVRRSFMPLRDGPRAEAAAEGEEGARRDRGGRRVREEARRLTPGYDLRLEGHWPNWLRHRPPKPGIPGSSPGCPASQTEPPPRGSSSFRADERRVRKISRPRGRGETGRHAGFRCPCAKALGGSSPSARIPTVRARRSSPGEHRLPALWKLEPSVRATSSGGRTGRRPRRRATKALVVFLLLISAGLLLISRSAAGSGSRAAASSRSSGRLLYVLFAFLVRAGTAASCRSPGAGDHPRDLRRRSPRRPGSPGPRTASTRPLLPRSSSGC